MSDYDGLNLPDLMALMHELVMPEPVSWLPETPGWWVAFGWLSVIAVIGATEVVRRRRRNRYRREATMLLKAIELQLHSEPAAVAAQIAALLKRTALVAYPRPTVAHLYGAEWARFLRETVSDDPEVAAAAERLASAAYRPDADGMSLVKPAQRWIRIHRA